MAELVAKQDRFSRKTLLCAWFNFKGVIHYGVVPINRTIDLYCAQLNRMHTELSRKYIALVNQKRMILKQDIPNRTPPEEPKKD